jgi:cardiolipin synthase A/B
VKTKEGVKSDILLKSLAAVGAGALLVHGSRLLLTLLGPPRHFKLDRKTEAAIDSESFTHFLSAATDAAVQAGGQFTVLRNGSEFYPSELEAIRSARVNVQLEFYTFHEGRVANQFLDALTERARAGVEVKLVIDAIGSLRTANSYFDGLRSAGGRVHWYHPIDWKTWPYANNRTHRKLIVVDGRTGFLGGAGIADHWLYDDAGAPPWRDTVLRVEGPPVSGLMSVLAENWVECCGEILAGAEHFPLLPHAGQTVSLVVNSTPESGATRARILFQALIESARKSIRITTPYFLPDRSARHALIQAMRERDVNVQVITAGRLSDHTSITKLSEAVSIELVRAGAELYEYESAMIHAKLMTIDETWSVAGSTNFDHRSFALNDEVNVAILDRRIAARLNEDFESDRAQSRLVTLHSFRQRSLSTKAIDNLSWVFRREQ